MSAESGVSADAGVSEDVLTARAAPRAALRPVPGDQVFQEIGRTLTEKSKGWPARGGAAVREPGMARPDGPVPSALVQMLNEVVDCLGERWIGGPWKPADDLPNHTTHNLEGVARGEREQLAEALAQWSGLLGGDRVLLLLYLWWQCWLLWDRCLVYRTLQVVEDAVTNVSGFPPAMQDWETGACGAVAAAMGLINADAEVFKQVNLESSRKTAEAAGKAMVAAGRARDSAAQARRVIESALAKAGPGPEKPGDARGPALGGLRYLEAVSDESEIFYGILADVGETVSKFEDWLAEAAPPDAGRPPGGGSCRVLAAEPTLVASVEASLSRLRIAQQGLSGLMLSRCEPWERLLVEILQVAAPPDSSDGAKAVSRVLVPKRVWVRYCYPFAVEENDACPLSEVHPNLAQQPARPPSRGSPPRLHGRLEEELGGAMAASGSDRRWLTVGEPVDLAPTEFFQALGSEQGLYGGVRVDLPDIEVGDRSPGRRGLWHPMSCRVWLELSRMGNHCLCVETIEPLQDPPPLPHLLNRALRAGTPFVYGEEVVPVMAPPHAARDDHRPSWDSLHTFARDVIRAAAAAVFWADGEAGQGAAAPFVRGNLHEVVIVQTDDALGPDPGQITDALDAAVGGRVLFRSIQRAAGTLDEWIRFPKLARNNRADRSTVVPLPELGFAGDWFVHTGETSIFGVVAVPSWLRDVYAQAAQFAGSWTPVLRLWQNRLESAIDELRSDGTPQSRPEDLRKVEQRVRVHLTQINSEQLCATLGGRRFLDELLEMAGVGRLERELEAQLGAAEQLTDWYRAEQRQKGEQRRNILLFLIALLGIFSLGDFMALANETHLHGSLFFIRLGDGAWEDWFILVAFFIALVAGAFLLGLFSWLRHPFRHKRAR